MTAMTLATAARVEAHLGLLADRIEEEALLSHVFPSEEIAEAIGQGNAARNVAMEVQQLVTPRRRRRDPAPSLPAELALEDEA